jgi:hypothetical protein
MKRHNSRMPVTAADKKMSKDHLKATMKLEKKKIKDHVKMSKKTTGASRSYHLGHATDHKKNIKEDLKHLKKVNKVKVKAGK